MEQDSCECCDVNAKNPECVCAVCGKTSCETCYTECERESCNNSVCRNCAEFCERCNKTVCQNVCSTFCESCEFDDDSTSLGGTLCRDHGVEWLEKAMAIEGKTSYNASIYSNCDDCRRRYTFITKAENRAIIDEEIRRKRIALQYAVILPKQRFDEAYKFTQVPNPTNLVGTTKEELNGDLFLIMVQSEDMIRAVLEFL